MTIKEFIKNYGDDRGEFFYFTYNDTIYVGFQSLATGDSYYIKRQRQDAQLTRFTGNENIEDLRC